MPFQNHALGTVEQVALKTVFICQIGVGTAANVVLFFYNVFPILFCPKRRPTHVILTHMAMANSIVLLSSGMPHMMAAFGLRNPLSTLGCKLVYYVRRVARSATLCSTCILSTYQAITLLPARPGWRMLRGTAPMAIGRSCCTCWIFSILTNVHILLKVTGPRDLRNYTHTQYRWFCSSLGYRTGSLTFCVVIDAMFIGLLAWTSGSMMFFLQRHRQKVQHIHPPNYSHRCLPETRATYTILMLVVPFVNLYTANSILGFYLNTFVHTPLRLLYTSHVLASCFPTLSPFLLIFRDPRALRFLDS